MPVFAKWTEVMLPTLGARLHQHLNTMSITAQAFEAQRRFIDTPSGRIAYVEQGKGPVALFVHGVLVNGFLWRHQLAQLSQARRCIALDLLAHGATVIDPAQDVSSTANATMSSSMR
jgi:hypothetical protein